MAATLTNQRADAAKAVLARLTEVGRTEAVPGWARHDHPTVIALESDELADVLLRCQRHDQAVLVGVYYPQTGEVEAVEMSPLAVALEPSPNSTHLGDGVTIGMLLAVFKPDRWERLLERATPVASA